MNHIYHHNDADGRLSAAIVMYGNRKEPVNRYELHECAYGPAPTFEEVAPGDVVYIVDYSFKDEDFARLIGRNTADIIWIDHHKTHEHSVYQSLPGIRSFVDKGPAACQLVWQYFFGTDPHFNQADLPPPAIVTLVGDYDSWAHRHAPECIQLYEACKGDQELQTPLGWKNLLEQSYELQEQWVTNAISCGREILKYRDGYLADMRKAYGHRVSLWDPRWYAIGSGLETGSVPAAVRVARPSPQPEVAFEEINPKTYPWAFDSCLCAYAMNIANFGSAAFGDEVKNYPFVIAYAHTGKEFSVSLYSTNSTIDCSVIAKAFGGGGHKGAAGFRCTELPWQVSRYTTRVVDIEKEKAAVDFAEQEKQS